MKNFVIGIGSQRAGSTLLHKLLDESTEIYFNPIKELHYFDTLYKVRSQNALTSFSKKQFDREMASIYNSKTPISFSKKHKNLIRSSYILHTSKIEDVDYIDLFRPCVNDYNYLGEITPEYSILDVDAIQYMKKTLNNPKIIFIVRNPVKRFISAYKLLKLYGKDSKSVSFSDSSQELLDILDGAGGWLDVQDRFNDYKTIISKYESVFQDILVLSYDQLYLEPLLTANKIEEYLGIHIDRDKYNALVKKRVNSLGDDFDITEEVYQKISDRYINTTSFLEEKFGRGGCVN